MDWGQYEFSDGVWCVIFPRENYQGRLIYPEVAALRGRLALLVPIWFMGEDESYPGEWALGDAEGENTLASADRGWISSGDVTPLISPQIGGKL